MKSKKFRNLITITVIILSITLIASADIWTYHRNSNHADLVLANNKEVWVLPNGADLVRWDLNSGKYTKYGAGDASLIYGVNELAYDDNKKLLAFDHTNIYRYENEYFNLVTTAPESYYYFGYADGSIIMASENLKKVIKFNGETWDEITDLSNYTVYYIWNDPQGGFWFQAAKTEDGKILFYYKNGIQLQFSRLEITNTNLNYIGFNHIFVDSKGIVWASLNGGAAWYDGKKWNQYYWDDLSTLDIHNVINSVEDNDGNIWFAANLNGLVKYDRQNFTKVPEYEDVKVLWVDKAAMGGIFVGTEESLEYFDGTTRTPITIPNQLPISNETTAVTIDPDGNLWCGDKYGDLAYLRQSEWRHFRGRKISEKESGDIGQLNCLLPSSFQGIWAAFTREVFKYDGQNWISYSNVLEPEIGVGYYDLAEGPSGDIWVTTTKSLAQWNGSSWKFHHPKADIPQHNHVICFDNQGKLWLVTNSSLYSYDGKEWKQNIIFDDINLPSYFYGNTITIMKDGNIWIGSRDIPCIAVFHDDEIVKTFTKEDGLPFTDDNSYNDGINGIKQAPDDSIWVSSQNGLLHFDGTQFKLYSTYRYNDFAIDLSGNLFFPGSGIAEFTPTSLTLKMSLFADQIAYKAGDKLNISLMVNNYGPDETGDLYFVMLAPDGNFYSGMDWSQGLHPAASNFTIPANFSLPVTKLLSLTLPSTTPLISQPGKYYFAIALADTGTTYLRSKAIITINVQ
jgi:hypothetical protein